MNCKSTAAPPEIFIQNVSTTGNACRAGGFGSRHGTTFGAAFCDGSVRHVGFEIDAVTVWRPLGSRNGRETLNLPW
jgi:prepilin-type processing-associated H-X9-DG protein